MKYSITFMEDEDSRTVTEAYTPDELGETIAELVEERGAGSYLIELECEDE